MLDVLPLLSEGTAGISPRLIAVEENDRGAILDIHGSFPLLSCVDPRLTLGVGVNVVVAGISKSLVHSKLLEDGVDIGLESGGEFRHLIGELRVLLNEVSDSSLVSRQQDVARDLSSVVRVQTEVENEVKDDRLCSIDNLMGLLGDSRVDIDVLREIDMRLVHVIVTARLAAA